MEIGGQKFRGTGPLIEIEGQKFRDDGRKFRADGRKLADDGSELEKGGAELRCEGRSFLLESPKGRHRKSLPTKNGLEVFEALFP